MTTKKQSSATTSHKSGNTRVNSATINVASVNVPAPTGNGLSDGTKVTGSEPVAVGSSSASAKRAARMDYNTKLYNAIKFEQIGVMGARELAAKVTAHFKGAEWIGPKADSVRAMLDSALDDKTINKDQYDSMWRSAAKNSGVDLTPPAISVGRVLVVIRRECLEGFVNLVGMSFSKVLDHVRKNGLNTYTWRLSCGAVLADSDINDFLAIEEVTDITASSVVSALLSLSVLTDYNRRLSAARSEARSMLHNSLCNAIRSAKQLGMSDDEISQEIRGLMSYVSEVDMSARKRLLHNYNAAIASINGYNDQILALGGAAQLELSGTSAKVKKTINGLIAKRSQSYSVADTCYKLLH